MGIQHDYWRDVASCCNTLRHTVAYCNTLNYTATHCAATHCNTLQHTAAHCSTLQHSATHCNGLQHTATNRNTLQHTATQCTQAFNTIIGAMAGVAVGGATQYLRDKALVSRESTRSCASWLMWLISMCDKTSSYVWQNSFYVWHDLFLCLRHDSLLRHIWLTWLISVCDVINVAHFYMWRD